MEYRRSSKFLISFASKSIKRRSCRSQNQLGLSAGSLEFYRSINAFSPALHWNNITSPVPIALSGVTMIVSPR